MIDAKECGPGGFGDFFFLLLLIFFFLFVVFFFFGGGGIFIITDRCGRWLLILLPLVDIFQGRERDFR